METIMGRFADTGANLAGPLCLKPTAADPIGRDAAPSCCCRKSMSNVPFTTAHDKDEDCNDAAGLN